MQHTCTCQLLLTEYCDSLFKYINIYTMRIHTRNCLKASRVKISDFHSFLAIHILGKITNWNIIISLRKYNSGLVSWYRNNKATSAISIQCSGSVTVWYVSGSLDPYLWLIDPDPDPDPALFVVTLKMPKKIFYVFCLLLFECTFTSFFTD